jgi:hypothetical protein
MVEHGGKKNRHSVHLHKTGLAVPPPLTEGNNEEAHGFSLSPYSEAQFKVHE